MSSATPLASNRPLLRLCLCGVVVVLGLVTVPATSAQPATVAPLWPADLATRYPSFLPFFVAPRPDHSLGPVLSARSALLYDIDTGQVLYARAPARRLPIASLTKLMTTAVVLEAGIPLEQPVTVPREATALEPSKLYLLAGDAMTVRDLVFASLIASANDAAQTLSTLLPDTVAAMNARAYRMGLYDTAFANPTGLDQAGAFATAVDVARMLQATRSLPLAERAMRTRHTEVASSSGRRYELDNTNILLGRPGIEILAGKTGTTDDAGQCLAVLVRVPDGRRLLLVLLGSRARFPEASALLAWALRPA